MQSLRWLAMIMGMLFGYSLAGPIGGLVGLAGGWWLSRRNVLRAPPPPPPRQPARPSNNRLVAAYRELGIDQHASMDDVRTAYRRRLSRTHPDKLAASGADKATLDDAARRTHALREAYDTIRKARRGE
ncbi:DnaJ domain-containing protein [Methylonatrum kenyense]|uniref:J domain-containing protein n=1 Tax=Methylonatrum kenyense TaxID=455253 RepID=UPI0020BE60CD|nr:DnaJ domain-containing protein [Methylonatrum kenyense]MCK8515482.1 DnaJ domain-containing protein [Methylonatrum kenyense]